MTATVLNTNSNPQPVAAPEGHDAKMVEAYEKSQQPQVEAPKEQELIDGKFKSQEDLLKAYKELEKRLGQGKTEGEPKQGTPVEQPKVEPGVDEEAAKGAEGAQEAVDKAGLNMGELEDYYSTNGNLSDDHYAKLEKAGISRDMVDTYIQGQQAIAEKSVNEVLTAVGGKDKYQAITAWAAANLSQAEIEAYNKATATNDIEQVKQAVNGLAFRYQQSQGSEPQLVGGGAPTKGAGFESVAQLTEAMKDPRYEKDPAYRREVEAKLSRSNIL